MHESSLIYRILEEVRPSVKEGMALRTVALEVGEFSCVNTQTLTQLFDIAKRGTFASESKLEFSVIKSDSDVIIKAIEVGHANRNKQRRIRGRKRTV